MNVWRKSTIILRKTQKYRVGEKACFNITLSLRFINVTKMKVAGFTIVRNAVKYDYPVLESIRSILPLCDVFYIGLGQSEDGTKALLDQLESPKIRIIDSVWDDDLRKGGRVLAVETNKVFRQIPAEYDWVFYLQADEVVHEKFYPEIRKAMLKLRDMKRVEGLLFRYRHFYGSYDFFAESDRWYRHEIRIIRNDKDIFSYRDAQGFRKRPNRKLRVKLLDAEIYHYGWVKDPRKMQRKYVDFQKLWHDDRWIEANVVPGEAFPYEAHIEKLSGFTGTHPVVMQKRIAKRNWSFDADPEYRKLSLKNRFRDFVERYTGYRLWEYRNYKL